MCEHNLVSLVYRIKKILLASFAGFFCHSYARWIPDMIRYGRRTENTLLEPLLLT